MCGGLLKKIYMTKIQTILQLRNMSQGDLIRIILKKSGFKMGRDRISMICTGRLKNYTVETAVMLAEALDVPINSIVEIKNVKKENKVDASATKKDF
jgi:hypothetical protein